MRGIASVIFLAGKWFPDNFKRKYELTKLIKGIYCKEESIFDI